MKIHQLSGYIQGIYLVEYDHALLLLDGCCRADVSRLQRFIEQELQRPFSDLKMVLVTHMHPDHAGAAHTLRKRTGCQIASADKDTHWYRGFNGVLMHWIDVVLTLYVGKKMGRKMKYVAYSRKLKPDHHLADGDVVPGFPDWSVLETPGHTDRDLSVWHRDSHWIYVADLFIKLRNKYIHPFPIFHPNKYKRSLQRVHALKAAKIALAHGGVVTMTDESFATLIDHSPPIPRTPLRASILKFKHILRQFKAPKKPG
ncbi:MBL fold metallo-hydrolase [Marinicella meishanensis]|uniref:MBL fold metallo-hydrolase n=1 Tax=Marinicella meishanensis TaxID=2873263 RepID=UPI001CBFA816|nr:MBL fold metallo-hydrolase [Marinicella sp. NBU2979]